MKFEEWLENCTDEELNEIMNDVSKYRENSKGLIGRWEFSTKNDNDYVVYCSKLSNDVYHILFNYKTKEGYETSSLTNFNDTPTVIFNTVYTIIEKEVIQKYKPKELRFEAEGNKRQKVYDVLMKRYIGPRMKKYGYILHMKQKPFMKTYTFIKEKEI